MRCSCSAALSSFVQSGPLYKRGTSLCTEINSFCLPGSGVGLPGSEVALGVALLGSGVCLLGSAVALPDLGILAADKWLTAQMQVINMNKWQNRLFIS